MTLARSHRLRAILIAAAAALLVAALGGLATDLGPWYAALRQPPWKPPDAWFGPAWTLIYACTAAAAVVAWRRAPTRVARQNVLVLVSGNAVLNIVWSLLFFRLKRPDWALAEVVLLWASIVVLIVVLGRIARTSGVLLLPYLAWVTFAGALNAAVVKLNGPFA